jgi:hypothetical protein
MSELEWKLAYPLDDDSAIKEIEGILGKDLPNEFCEVIIKNNEASPSKSNFKTRTGAEHVFCNLISFNEDEDTNVFNTLEILRSNGLEEGMFPFGEDPFGNYLCLYYQADDVTVVFWNHETGKIEKISDSFSEFLKLLY